MTSRCQIRGFTLIELLVVITIIVVLIGLSLPAMALVRENAKRAEARQTVVQLLQSFELYSAEDDRKRYPYPGPFGNPGTNPYGPSAVTYHHYPEGTDPERAFAIAFRDEVAGVKVDGVLTLLEAKSLPLPNLKSDHKDDDRRLLDPWLRPYRYRFSLPGATRTAFTCADSPSTTYPMTDWNWDATNNRESARNGRDPTLARAYPYVYSWGKKGTATDPCTWIYREDKR